MNADIWQTGNAHYLSAALEWLRLKLTRLAKAEIHATDSAGSTKNASLKERMFGRSEEAAHGPTLALPPASPAEQIVRAAEAMEAAEKAMDVPPALVLLGQRLRLSRFERDILLLCAALELNTGVAAMCARAQDDPSQPYPTFALALALFDGPSWDALSPDRPLRYCRLIEINQPGAQPLTTSALRADERIVSYLKGLNTLDDRLTPLLTPVEAEMSDALPPSQQAAADFIVNRWQKAATTVLPVAQLIGPDTASKRLVAVEAAASLGRVLYQLPVESIPGSASELETLSRLWQRESLLLPLALYVDAQELDGSSSESPVIRFLARADGVVFLSTRENWPGLRRAHFTVEVAKPAPAEQRAAWAEALGTEAGNLPDHLAAQFSLNLPTIEQIAQNVRLAEDLPQAVWDACRAASRPRLDALAQRLEPKVAWDDLVLPAEQINLLRQIVAQVGQRHKVYETWGFAQKMNRGLGLTALFAGESGTGKTMAAEVLANDLQLNLYRIDLSAVVSKYIGETEKNLRRLFDAAEDGGAILFFDEADALFGKRSEVKDSHDRYANIEINYLLQRMEAYRGLAILATNLKSALDTAFMRRLRFIANFAYPGVAERKLMWQKVFPPQMPKDALDYDRLAKLTLTGGNIHSVALNAAFMAAQDGGRVTMPLVLAAARTEFRKLEKPINEVDFRLTH